MSQLSDAIKAANDAADAAITRAQNDHATLEQQISDLQNKLNQAGTPDPADVQALADLTNKLNALDAVNDIPTGTGTAPPDTGTAPPDAGTAPADQGGTPNP